jgi:6-pyruvoyltetrahydropterin/6-carboxytetrahydropterin synthase
MNYTGACANVHGHNYVVEVTATGSLDVSGFVVDFSELKKQLGAWLDKHWDHGFLFYEKDDAVWSAFHAFTQPQKLCPLPFNPTAENLAEHLLNQVCPNLFKDSSITITRIRIYETENCYAEAIRD